MKAQSHWAVEEERDAEYAVSGYDVSTPVPGPRTVYQGFFDFGFHLPSPETTVVVDASAARLVGSFHQVQTQVPAASISNSVPPIVTLDSAREVRSVDLIDAGNADVQLFRVDQSQLAPKPTVTKKANSAGVATFSGFTDVRFAVAVDGGTLTKGDIAAIYVQGAPTGGRLGLADPAGSAAPTFFWTAPNGTGTDADAGPAFAAALQAYLAAKAGDTSPAVRLVIQCDQPCRFAVTSFDTGASFAIDGFAFPELAASDLTDPGALAARIAAAADPVSAHLRSAIGRAALLDGLNAVIAGDALYDAGRFAGITLGPQTEAARTAGDLPRLNRLLLQDAYPDLVAAPSAKRVLRFPADRAGQAGVAVSLPAGASVSKATLSTQESLGGDRPDDAGAATTAPVGGSGIHVSGDDSAAVSVEVEQALTATGLALPLLGLAGGTQVAAELIEDDQGAPAGKRLAAATVALSPPGTVAWATVHFDPVVLDSGPVWIALRAPKGEAVWLGTAAQDGLHVVRTPDDGSPTEDVLPGLQPSYQLLARGGSAADAPATTLQLAGETVAAARGGDRSTYDLAAALKAHANGGGAVPLTFTSSAAGTITVYPPHVEFEV